MKFSFRLCNVDACNAKIKTVLNDLDNNRFRREWGSSVSTNRFDECVACPRRTLSDGWTLETDRQTYKGEESVKMHAIIQRTPSGCNAYECNKVLEQSIRTNTPFEDSSNRFKQCDKCPTRRVKIAQLPLQISTDKGVTFSSPTNDTESLLKITLLDMVI
jgi:hypothetical protein